MAETDALSDSQLFDIALETVNDGEVGSAWPAAEMTPRLVVAVPDYVLAQAVGAPEGEVDGVADLGGEKGEEGGLGLGVD
jgi:hypothetical protein